MSTAIKHSLAPNPQGAGISKKVANSAAFYISLSHFPFDKHHYIFLCRPRANFRKLSGALGRTRRVSGIVRRTFQF